jgi:hypothetical protein
MTCRSSSPKHLMFFNLITVASSSVHWTIDSSIKSRTGRLQELPKNGGKNVPLSQILIASEDFTIQIMMVKTQKTLAITISCKSYPITLASLIVSSSQLHLIFYVEQWHTKLQQVLRWCGRNAQIEPI